MRGTIGYREKRKMGIVGFINEMTLKYRGGYMELPIFCIDEKNIAEGPMLQIDI